MYTCVCNAIRECELRKAARQYRTGGAESVYAKLGKTPNCGQCLDEAQLVIDEERDALMEPATAA
ncbi:ferredoxin [Erythrobacter alti]|uniref:(2Fe-2S)-binding protein n=1 Tax=Erythrobacter alti TaxID=1896145 RepID=UPI0030F40192